MAPIGYIVMKICGVMHMGHRVAWFLHYGKWPDNCIDHINGIKHDNRISNLRDVTTQENRRNARRPMKGKIYGVRTTESGKWSSYIKISGRVQHLGTFDTLLDAACARKSSELKHGFHRNHNTMYGDSP